METSNVTGDSGCKLMSREEFILNFVEKAASNGFDLDDLVDFGIMLTTPFKADDRLVKEAAVPAGPLAAAVAAGSQAGNLATQATKWLIPVAIAAPPIVGGTLGALAAKAQDVDEESTDEFNRRRILQALNSNAALVEEQLKKNEA